MSAPVDPVAPVASLAPVDDPKVYQALDKLADHGLIDGIERRATRPITREAIELVRTTEPALHVAPETWGIGFLAVHDRDRPPQLVEDLKEVTPQASLRDLFRPVMENRWHERVPLEHNVDRGAQQAYAEARAAQVLDPLPHIPPTVEIFVEEQQRRRAWLKEAWEPAMPDSEPRRSVDVYREPSLIA